MKRRRGADLSGLELFVAAEIVPFVPLVAVLIRAANLRALVGPLGRVARAPMLRNFPIGHERIRDPERVARVVGAATHLVLGPPACLVRSVLLYWMLSARGLAPRLHLGVAKREAWLAAHAWVEVEGRVVGEPTEVIAPFVRLVQLESR